MPVAPAAPSTRSVSPDCSRPRSTQAWNADESYLLLYEVGHGHLLYDGQTYEYVRAVAISPPDREQVY